MKKLEEVLKAILKYENEKFGNEFTFSQIKEMSDYSDKVITYTGASYVEYPYTNFHYEIIGKNDFENYWDDRIIELADDCYIPRDSEMIQRYFDYDRFIDDIKQEGRATFFNGYDGYTELETEDYYIYLWNKNYDKIN